MAITPIGTLGTGANSSSVSSWTFNTATNTLSAQDVGILIISTDNIATVDGPSSTHTSVTGLNGTWTKLGEYTNTVGGAAGDGVTISIWMFVAAGTVATGSTVTMTTSANTTDKACTFHKFTKGAGKTLQLETEAASVGNTTDASNGFGSASFSGLSSAARLYLRGLAKEANSTTQITPSTSFTAITKARSRNNANAVYVSGEFRVNTSTGETSNPTLAVAGDTAALFIALEEVDYQPTVTTVLPTRVPASAITSTVLTIGLGILQSVLGQSATPPINQTDWPVYRTTAALTIETDSYPSEQPAGSLPTGETELGRVSRWPAYRPASIDPFPQLLLAAPPEAPPSGESVQELPPSRKPAAILDVGSVSLGLLQPVAEASPAGEGLLELPLPQARRAVQYEQPIALPYIAGDPVRPDAADKIARGAVSRFDWAHGWAAPELDLPDGQSFTDLPAQRRLPVYYDQARSTIYGIAGDPVPGDIDPAPQRQWAPPVSFALGPVPDALAQPQAVPVGGSVAELPKVPGRFPAAFSFEQLPYVAGDPAGEQSLGLPAPRQLPAPKFDHVDSLPFVAGDPVGEQRAELPPPQARRAVQYEQPIALPYIAGDPVRPDAADRVVRPRAPFRDQVTGWTAAQLAAPAGATSADLPAPVRRPVRDFVASTIYEIAGDPVPGAPGELAARRWTPAVASVAGPVPSSLVAVTVPVGLAAMDVPRASARPHVGFAIDALPFVAGDPVRGYAIEPIARARQLVADYVQATPPELAVPVGNTATELPVAQARRAPRDYALNAAPYAAGNPTIGSADRQPAGRPASQVAFASSAPPPAPAAIPAGRALSDAPVVARANRPVGFVAGGLPSVAGAPVRPDPLAPPARRAAHDQAFSSSPFAIARETPVGKGLDALPASRVPRAVGFEFQPGAQFAVPVGAAQQDVPPRAALSGMRGGFIGTVAPTAAAPPPNPGIAHSAVPTAARIRPKDDLAYPFWILAQGFQTRGTVIDLEGEYVAALDLEGSAIPELFLEGSLNATLDLEGSRDDVVDLEGEATDTVDLEGGYDEWP